MLFLDKRFVESGIIGKSGFHTGGKNGFATADQLDGSVDPLHRNVLVDGIANIFFEEPADVMLGEKGLCSKLIQSDLGGKIVVNVIQNALYLWIGDICGREVGTTVQDIEHLQKHGSGDQVIGIGEIIGIAF